MIVCHCRARRAEDILAAARACGSHEPEVVAEAACAGDDCGSCLRRIEQLLADGARRRVATAA